MMSEDNNIFDVDVSADGKDLFQEDVKQEDVKQEEIKQEEVKQVEVENKPAVTQGSALPSVTIEQPNVGDFSGIQTVQLGQRISRVPIERYKGTTIKNDRISFITRDVTAIKTHYIENIGSIICFTTKERTGKCCTMAGLPSVRYLFPVVLYSTDNEGNIISSKVDLRMLSAGEDLYKSIIVADRATGGKLDKFDVLVTCTDDKYQKLTLNAAGPAQWLKSEKVINTITEQWNNNKDSAYMAVARMVDEKSFRELLGDDYQESNSPQPTFNNTNTDLSNFFGE